MARDSVMGDEQITEADIWLSRVNIAQARSQKLLQSWLPKARAQNASSSTPADEDDENDFVGMTESSGLGTAPKDSEFEVDGVLKKRHASSNDKLLEQLLGKKAAAAKRYEQAQARQTKSTIALGRAAPAPVNGAPTSAEPGASKPIEEDSEDEDEPGRAATFTGKKVTRDRNQPAYATGGSGRRGATPIDEDAEPPDPREDVATIEAMKNGTSQAHHDPPASEEEGPPAKKKKATSYLDELLSKKKKKKGRGKK